jgi:hypothetical protein
MGELKMELIRPDIGDGFSPLVRTYLKTAESGYPYIDCPDQLRPQWASPDSWWVIYAPSYSGGIIVEGYLIEHWRKRQRVFLLFWSGLALLLFYFFVLSGLGLALIIVLPAWIAVLPVASWFATKRIFAEREWVAFPQQLSNALQSGAACVAKQQTEEHRKQAVSEGIGRAAGKIGGLLVENAAGKAAGSVSEVAIENAFKGLAERLRSN